MVIEAHAAVRPITQVRIWERNPDKARAMAEHYADRYDTQAVTYLATASAQANIISCATLSSVPLIKSAWLRTGSHLDLVGAFKPNMCEVDVTCLRPSEVFVDTHAGAKGEAGDILQAVDEGAFDFSEIWVDMAQLLRGEHA